MDTRLSVVISHGGYCGLYRCTCDTRRFRLLAPKVMYTQPPHTHTHTHCPFPAAARAWTCSSAILLRFSILWRGFLFNAYTTLYSRAWTTSRDYFTSRPALKGNVSTNTLVFDIRPSRLSLVTFSTATNFAPVLPRVSFYGIFLLASGCETRMTQREREKETCMRRPSENRTLRVTYSREMLEYIGIPLRFSSLRRVRIGR